MPRVRRCKYKGCTAFAYLPNHYCQHHLKYEAQYQAERDKYRGIHRSVNKATTWRYNHVTRYRNGVKAEQNKFYHTKQWQALRKVVFQRDYHLCRYCKKQTGTIVDHVLPIEAFPKEMENVDNLVTCCRDCHAKKTKFEQDYYGTGLHNKLTGNPPIRSIATITKLMNAREGL